MGKIVNKRRVARLRHSAHPFAQDQARPVIASGGDDDASVLALSHDALESIQTQLKHELPRERMSGTAMIVQHITEETMDQSDSGDKIKDIIDSLCPLLLDRAENVRFGAFDAFCHLSSLSTSICKKIVAQDIFSTLIQFAHQHLLPIDSYGQIKSADRNLTLNILESFFELMTNLVGTVEETKQILLDRLPDFACIINKGLQACLETATAASDVELDSFLISIAASQFASIVLEDFDVSSKLLPLEIESGSQGAAVQSVQNTLSNIVLRYGSKPDKATTTNGHQSEVASLKQLHLLVNTLFTMYQCSFQAGNFSSLQLRPILEHCLQAMFQSPLVEQMVQLVRDLSTSSEVSSMDFSKYSLILPASGRQKGGNILGYVIGEVQRFHQIKCCLAELLTNLVTGFESGEEEVDEELMEQDDPSGSVNGANIKVEDSLLYSNVIDSILGEFELFLGGSQFLDSQSEDALKQSVVNSQLFPHLVITYQTSVMSFLGNLESKSFFEQNNSQTVVKIGQMVHVLTLKIVNKLNGMNQNDPSPLVKRLREDYLDLLGETLNVARELMVKHNDFSLEHVASLVKFIQTIPMDESHSAVQINLIKVIALALKLAIIGDSSSPELSGQVKEGLEYSSVLFLDLFDKAPANMFVYACEILDSLMDVWGVDSGHLAAVMGSIDLYGKLAPIPFRFKSMIKKNRSLLRSNPVVETVHDNLDNFVDYVRSEQQCS